MFISTLFLSVHVVLFLTATSALGALVGTANTTTTSNATAPAVSSDATAQLQNGFYRISWLDTSLGKTLRAIGNSGDRVAVLPTRLLPPNPGWRIERKATNAFSVSLDSKVAGFGPDASIELTAGGTTEWAFIKAPRQPDPIGDDGFIITRPIQGLHRADWEVPHSDNFRPGTIPLVIGEAGTVLQIVRNA